MVAMASGDCKTVRQAGSMVMRAGGREEIEENDGMMDSTTAAISDEQTR